MAATRVVDYDITPAKQEDFDKILEFLMRDFLYSESLNAALNVASDYEMCRDFFGGILKAALLEPYSYYVTRKSDGIVVGVRLASIVRRHPQNPGNAPSSSTSDKENSDNFSFAGSKFSEKLQKIQHLLEHFEHQIWKLVPENVDTLMSWLVLSVDKNFTRRGIASKLINLDQKEELQAAGIQGYVTEATAFMSQKLFEHEGYQRLLEIQHKDWVDRDGNVIFKCPDGTTKATLEYKGLS